MALNIITEAMIAEHGVQAAPDQLSGTAAENKAVFDRLITNVVAVYFNQLVEALTASTGAGEIGFSAQDLMENTELAANSLGAVLLGSVKSVVFDKDTKNVTVTLHNGETDTMNFTSPDGEAVAGKSTTVTATLLASGWADKEYDLAIDGVTAISNQELLPAIGIGGTELTALQGANIVDNGQEPGVMKLKAMGDVPEVDIPIRVVLRGD